MTPPSFLHLPSNTVVETDNHSQYLRLRRNHNFIELPQSSTNSPDSYEDAPDSPASSPHDPDTAPNTSTVPTGTVAQILEWVGNDYARAHIALARELEGKKRSTLIAALNKLT